MMKYHVVSIFNTPYFLTCMFAYSSAGSKQTIAAVLTFYYWHYIQTIAAVLTSYYYRHYIQTMAAIPTSYYYWHCILFNSLICCSSSSSSRGMEFRGFVYRRKFCALCQYDYLVKVIERRIEYRLVR
mmetsp:Transcript_39659/g.63633  ORF Transcript_39659/g.63633 Transcript_39659/m.63633 type:complete len:127 (+) Transcript_39659:816-1196(+)